MTELMTGEELRKNARRRQDKYVAGMQAKGYVRANLWVLKSRKAELVAFAKSLEHEPAPAPHIASDPDAFERAVEMTAPDTMIRELRADGRTWGYVATELNRHGYKTPSGRKWGESNLIKHAKRKGLTE